MFDKEYCFYGKHAEMVKEFRESKIFERFIDVYEIAPLVGFVYKRKAPIDKSFSLGTKDIIKAKIMGDRIIYSSDELKYNYKLIMLLDEERELNLEKRIDKVFRHFNADIDQSDEEYFESYVRGGIEVLYENIIEGCEGGSYEDFAFQLYKFIQEFEEKFNKNIDRNALQRI